MCLKCIKQRYIQKSIKTHRKKHRNPKTLFLKIQYF
nr:MAG TPA: hypothetical protein [Bacteriophage sp.]